MTTDYDAPRAAVVDDIDDELPELRLRAEPQPAEIDVDESDVVESFELPGADLSGEELSVRVIPVQQDEFVCSSCFLVHHRSRLAHPGAQPAVCRDCAA
ncbi:DUF4193 domain-containing protein [Mycobacterium hubeiense]|uniref:DUF4193 domain-containing protein n=1 Tax=Mycobacterium hubeiense TaxID=1867256 RepID=UPI000C7F59EA|nr:DUF4193 domain-containing protein [Mycobacterium sp. QGD 101]